VVVPCPELPQGVVSKAHGGAILALHDARVGDANVQKHGTRPQSKRHHGEDGILPLPVPESTGFIWCVSQN
jgi:hypothetical protein